MAGPRRIECPLDTLLAKMLMYEVFASDSNLAWIFVRLSQIQQSWMIRCRSIDVELDHGVLQIFAMHL